MLTGESVPVVKSALPTPSSSDREGQHAPFSGQETFYQQRKNTFRNTFYEQRENTFCPQRDKACAVLCGTKVVGVSPANTKKTKNMPAPGQHGEDVAGGRGGGGGGGGGGGSGAAIEGEVAAIVIRTGYLTAKGRLVRSILFPKEPSNDFFNDAVRFICALAALAGIGMIYQV
jgi:magnesium-transporting ATPase (P-type)